MNPRLIRALQRGGVTAKRAAPGWDVWRCQDRRRRKIGTFKSAEIDLLRLYDCLEWAPLSTGRVLIWQTSSVNARACLESLMAEQNDPTRQRACLDHLILAHRDAPARLTLAKTTRGFRRDAIAPSGPEMRDAEVCHRLSRIAATLSEHDCRSLYDLAITRATKQGLAKSYNQRAAAVETKADEVLKAIAQIYT